MSVGDSCTPEESALYARHSKALLESQHAETKTAGAELVPSEFQASLRNRTTVSKKKKKVFLLQLL